jgi:hypothetical protein
VPMESDSGSNTQSGGVNTAGNLGVAGDVVGWDKVTNIYQTTAPMPRAGSAPLVPSLFIGRDDGMRDLKQRLGIVPGGRASPTQVITAVRGWPGVGKTTMAAALAHDTEVKKAFPDGVLWLSIGEKPQLVSALAAWGRALGTDDLLRAPTLKEATTQLAALLGTKSMLLIVDDVWEAEHAEPFRQARGTHCALVFTTRIPSVARALAPTPDAVYNLPVLTDENALKLLSALAPSVVADHPKESHALVRDLECLPLALQVAGHMLQAEASKGWTVTTMLSELRSGAKLLKEKAPADRMDLEKQTIPTVAVLLHKSIERLDQKTRDCFAYLGPFAPKPATFDIAAMKSVWQVDDPKPIADALIDRGLLEPIGNGRFQMHALLVTLAKSLLR